MMLTCIVGIFCKDWEATTHRNMEGEKTDCKYQAKMFKYQLAEANTTIWMIRKVSKMTVF